MVDLLAKAVLNWLNVKHGIDLEDLPRGKRDTDVGCPLQIALATKYPTCSVGLSVWYPTIDSVEDLPQEVESFIEMFDGGNFPEYDITMESQEMNIYG